MRTRSKPISFRKLPRCSSSPWRFSRFRTGIQLCRVISSNRDASNTPRKTLLSTGGYDGTCEELFFSVAGGALKRGYNVLIFDGPGQGGALVMQKLPMRADWENVVYAGG